jgi:hypothetical protein
LAASQEGLSSIITFHAPDSKQGTRRKKTMANIRTYCKSAIQNWAARLSKAKYNSKNMQKAIKQ